MVPNVKSAKVMSDIGHKDVHGIVDVCVVIIGSAGAEAWITPLRAGAAVLPRDGLCHVELEQTGIPVFVIFRVRT